MHNGYYRKTTLGSLGAPDIPVKRGHTGAWSLPAETQVNSDLTVHAMYTANVYGVTFTSESAVEGWEEENGAYALRVQMAYGAAVSYYAGGTLFASASVSDGANVFALPEIPVWNGKEGAWTQISVSERGAEFYAEYPLDSVVYSSEITFTYNGAKYDSYRQQYEGEYSLITPVAEGYTFLGWYDKNDGWKRVEKLSPTADAGVTEVEALWISDAKVSVSGSRDRSRAYGRRSRRRVCERGGNFRFLPLLRKQQYRLRFRGVKQRQNQRIYGIPFFGRIHPSVRQQKLWACRCDGYLYVRRYDLYHGRGSWLYGILKEKRKEISAFFLYHFACVYA